MWQVWLKTSVAQRQVRGSRVLPMITFYSAVTKKLTLRQSGKAYSTALPPHPPNKVCTLTQQFELGENNEITRFPFWKPAVPKLNNYWRHSRQDREKLWLMMFACDSLRSRGLRDTRAFRVLGTHFPESWRKWCLAVPLLDAVSSFELLSTKQKPWFTERVSQACWEGH